MTTSKQEDTGVYHLLVGTEVSAKYRGAFCEAQIKSVKRNVIYKVSNKKTGKGSHVSEDSIKGILKIGSAVEVQFPTDQGGWQECTIQSTRDRSSYTVVFDDGDERTLPRGSLCLKGDRHYAKSETLDNLPLTDPENFGTPVLANKKSRQRRRPAEDEYDDEAGDLRTPEHDKSTAGKGQKASDEDNEDDGSSEEEEDDNEKRTKWLADPLMGKVVIVEPNDKRKHWFPGLVVNPLCYERYKDLSSSQLVVRSFKTGKFLRVSRSTLKEMSDGTTPTKLDTQWQDIIDSAQVWRDSRTMPQQWRTDIRDILSDSEEDESSGDESEIKKRKVEKKSGNEKSVTEEEKEEKKNHNFLEGLYKFMEDRGTPINKTPVLGYKDLDLYLLYKLVQKRKGSFSITSIKDWKQIYLDLGIPKPNPAAGYNVRTAYQKYLASFEEYCISWKHIPLPKKPCHSRSQSSPDDKKKAKRKEATPAKGTKKSEPDKAFLEKKKSKIKEKEKCVEPELPMEPKTRGRNSPLLPTFDEITSRRSGQRRKMSESSTTSDVTTSASGGKKNNDKNSHRVKGLKPKTEAKARNPGGPDSEPDESSRPGKNSDKKDGDKKMIGKILSDQMSRRIRRNSTSSLSTQYVQNDRLQVKYGYGKTFKLYDAKILQVKQPEGPGDSIEYLVHYAGWNSRHDEWIKPSRIVGPAEERSPVPPSPTSGSVKSQARRPKTPNGSRGLLVSSLSASDVLPSSRLSVDLMGKFERPAKEDSLPRSTKATNTEIPSLEPLKKNLTEEFEKAKEIRPISPVLLGQRTRRSKSPYQTPTKPFRPPSPQTTVTPLNPVKEEPTTALEEDTPRPESPKLPEPSPTEAKKLPVSTLKEEHRPVSPIIAKLQQEEVEVKHEPPALKMVDDSLSKTEDADKKLVSLKEEPLAEKQPDKSPAPEAESASGEDSNDASEGSSGGRQSSPPVQQPRRTSSRRSKSPAYLSDSAWYSMTKRRRGNAPENSPSPVSNSTASASTPEATAENQAVPMESEIQPIPSKRSPSPTLSVSSATSSSSSSPVERTDEKEKSPVLMTKAKADDNAKVEKITRKRTRRKSPDVVKEKGETTCDKIKEMLSNEKKQPQETSEYDNFDEDVPNIALEKYKKAGKLLLRTGDKRPVPLGLKYKNATSQGNSSEPKAKAKKAEMQELAAVAKPKKKPEDGNDVLSKRKIKNKKPPTPVVSTTLDHLQDKPVTKDVEMVKEDLAASKPPSPTPKPEDTSPLPQEITENNKAIEDQRKEITPEETMETLPAPAEVSKEEHNAPSTSATERVSAPAPSNFQQATHPVNPPSSSKVLLENTPPTTPEHSPTYISEEPDIDKHSPLMDSDMLDIGDEPKDSGDSGSSSSGFENPTSSSHELEKMETNAAGETKEEAGEEESKPQGDAMDEQVPSPSHKKKRGRGRRSKRRRTTSKSQGNGRNSYGNDQESESDNEADDETGEASGRKRNESGSRCKPKKKKAKARPEPPSAPPPLPREELESMSQDERIALLQSRMAEMRKVYHQLKQEVANIDRKRKRAKRREREAAEAESLARSAKIGHPPAVRAKGTPAVGKVESSGTSCGSAFSANCNSKQPIASGDLVDKDR